MMHDQNQMYNQQGPNQQVPNQMYNQQGPNQIQNGGAMYNQHQMYNQNQPPPGMMMGIGVGLMNEAAEN